MLFEKLGSLTLLAIAKQAGLLAAAVPALRRTDAPAPYAPSGRAPALADVGFAADEHRATLSATDLSAIVCSLHDEAIASIDLAAADLAELKRALASLGAPPSPLA